MNRMMSSRLLNFLEHGFQAVFKFASIFRSCDHRAQIQRDDSFSLQRFRNISCNNALRQAFDDGGLTNTRFSNQNGIVFGSPRKDLDDAPDFFVAPDDRIELSFARKLGQIARIALQAPDIFLRDSGP